MFTIACMGDRGVYVIFEQPQPWNNNHVDLQNQVEFVDKIKLVEDIFLLLFGSYQI